MRWLIVALGLGLASCLQQTAQAPPPAPINAGAPQPGEIVETVQFESASYPSFREFFRQQPPGERVTVSGRLGFPAAKTARYPAVIVVHTIGGYREENEGWMAARLREAGYATLTYDSFAARGLSGLSTSPNPPPWASALADAYAALRFLARDPRIDPKRIAIVGFSFGGEIARLAAWSLARDAAGPGGPRFAAHVAYYPAGVFGVIAYPNAYTGAPILMLLAGRDEAMPLAKWHAYRDYAASAGFPVPATEIVYPNASHGWTNPDFSAPRYNPQARSARACPTLMIMPGARGFLIDGKLQADDPALLQSCRESSRGYTMAYDESIRARSTSDALAFLGRALHAN